MDERRHTPRRTVLTEADQVRVAEVFQDYRRFVEIVAARHAPSVNAVPDIVSTVGLKMCQSLNGFRGDSELKTWLYRVTVNTARDVYRAERRQVHRPLEAMEQKAPTEPVIDPDEQVRDRERLAALGDAIERLRPRHQRLICNQLQNATVQPDKGKDKTARHRARQELKAILRDDPRLE